VAAGGLARRGAWPAAARPTTGRGGGSTRTTGQEHRTAACSSADTSHSREDRKQAKQARIKQSDTTRPLRIELQRIDERLPRLVAEKAQLEARLAEPGSTAQQYADLGRDLAHASAEIAMLEERWLELQAELEALGT
jgi:ATP-binding cassette subfamily F protein 3